MLIKSLIFLYLSQQKLMIGQSHTENPGQEEESGDPKKPWILHTLAK